MCVCVCVKNILKMWPLEFQCGFLKMPPGSQSGFLKLTSSAHREMTVLNRCIDNANKLQMCNPGLCV